MINKVNKKFTDHLNEHVEEIARNQAKDDAAKLIRKRHLLKRDEEQFIEDTTQEYVEQMIDSTVKQLFTLQSMGVFTIGGK